MKKYLKYLFALIASLSVVSFEARADEPPLYTCEMSGEISGASVGFILGGQYLSGDGMITCTSRDGRDVRTLPVTMKLISAGWAFDFTIVESLKIYSVGIGLRESPEALLQSYSLGATAGATLLKAGVDFDVAVKASPERDGGVALELGLKGKEAIGLGVRLHAMAFAIESRN